MTEPVLKTRNCRWIAVPGAADARGRINFLEVGKGLPFRPQAPVLAASHRARPVARPARPSRVAAGDWWRCTAPARSISTTASVKETVALDDPAKGLYRRHLGVARAHGFRAAGGGPGDRLDALRRGRVSARLRGLQARSGGEDDMIPFLDMKSVYAELKPELDAAYARVMESGWFVLGKEVEAFEAEYAAFCGTTHCVGLANGLEALELVLARLGPRRRRRGDRAVQHLYRDLARGDGGGRQGGAGRADARRAQHRSRPHRRRDHAAHPGDHAGPSLRRAGRHGRHHGAGRQARAQGGRGRGAGAGRQGARPARPARWAMPARTASSRPRTSAPSAMAARSPPTTPGWPSGCACCATTAAG